MIFRRLLARTAHSRQLEVMREVVSILKQNDRALLLPKHLFQLPPSDWEGTCRRLAMGVNVGDDTVLCRTLARFKMYVSTRDVGLAPHLIADGYWELWTTRVMTDILEPGMVCIDAGANIGYYTVLMADIAGPTGRVIAAEPVPSTRAYLKRNVDINGFYVNTQILDVAFGAAPGEVTLHMPPGEPKNALIWDACPDPTWEKCTAPVIPIDHLDLPQVDFIKIDVEGAEIDVWRGMQETVRRCPQLKIMMEVNCARYPEAAAEFIRSIEEIYPLRYVDFSAQILPITADEVLAATDDVMLYLERAAPSSQA